LFYRSRAIGDILFSKLKGTIPMSYRNCALNKLSSVLINHFYLLKFQLKWTSIPKKTFISQ